MIPDDDAVRTFLQRTNTTLEQIMANPYVRDSLVFGHFAAQTIRPRQALGTVTSFRNYGISVLDVSWVDASNATLNGGVGAPNCNGLVASVGVANSSTPVRACVPSLCSGAAYVIGGVLVDTGLDAYIRNAGPGLARGQPPKAGCESLDSLLFYHPFTSISNWVLDGISRNGTTRNSSLVGLTTRGSYLAVSDGGWLRLSASLGRSLSDILSTANTSTLVGLLQYHSLPTTKVSEAARRSNATVATTALANQTMTIVPNAARTCTNTTIVGGASNATVTQCDVGDPCGLVCKGIFGAITVVDNAKTMHPNQPQGAMYIVNNVLLPNVSFQFPFVSSATPLNPVTIFTVTG